MKYLILVLLAVTTSFTSAKDFTSFSSAKKYLSKNITENSKTIYCGCTIKKMEKNLFLILQLAVINHVMNIQRKVK